VLAIAEAESLAKTFLLPLGDRWRHVQAVANKAIDLSRAVTEADRTLLIVAAWWHDLGYAPELRRTGMHQIDGARYLASAGYPDRLCALVAHHSAATFEADERGLAAELAMWPREEGAVADALWAADMTTGPTGEPVTYVDRLDDILHRYRPGTVVARAMMRAQPSIEAAIERTSRRLDR
jgi:putative nucleotidyltransferase with HDIG domain